MTPAMLLVLLASPFSAAASADPPKETGVIIVGAGMAGITAARQLQAAGVPYVVLEAQDRIGGRAIVDARFETPIDLGGAWVHGVETNPLTPWVHGAGRTLVPTDVDATHHVYLNGRFARAHELAVFSCILEVFEENLASAVSPSRSDIPPKALDEYVDGSAAGDHLPEEGACEEEVAALSVGDWTFDQLRELAALNVGPLESAVELSRNATPDAANFEAGQDSLILGGYGAFVADFAKPIAGAVQLNQRVKKIEYKDQGVTVTTDKGTWKGDRVLVTVSTGLLADKERGIAFSPELPSEKQEAIQHLPMGVLNKVIMQFDGENPKMRWPTDAGATLDDRWVLYGGDPANHEDDLAFVFRPGGSDIIIAFVGGDRAISWEKAEKGTPFTDAALNAVSDMCDCQARDALELKVETRWATSPISLGAYSAAVPSTTNWRAVLARPVADRVYFAGEATYNSQYNGSYAAAYSSALVASQAILESLCAQGGPQARPAYCIGGWPAAETSAPVKSKK